MRTVQCLMISTIYGKEINTFLKEMESYSGKRMLPPGYYLDDPIGAELRKYIAPVLRKLYEMTDIEQSIREQRFGQEDVFLTEMRKEIVGAIDQYYKECGTYDGYGRQIPEIIPLANFRLTIRDIETAIKNRLHKEEDDTKYEEYQESGRPEETASASQ